MAKELYFRCDEKYAPRHQCKPKQLRVIIASDDEEEDKEGKLEEEDVEEGESGELSMLSIEGLTSPRTMKLFGKIKECEIMVLIDSRATHNFIDLSLVEELGFSFDRKRFPVTLSDGRKIKCGGKCGGVMLELQDLTIVQNFLSIEQGDMDIILGIEWLSMLGEVNNNWRALRMQFRWEGKQV